jgi:hypothetical protein
MRCRRFIAVLGALAAALVLAASAGADASGGANNVVLAQTTTDGSWLARASTQIVSFGGDTLASANIASATASDCTGCHSSAVAVQVVLVTGSPSTFVPANVASAANGACDACGSYAYAWQYVVEASGPVHLSSAALAQIADLRQRIADVAGSIEPTDVDSDQQLDSELNDLTAQLKQVVDDGITAAGVAATGAVEREIQH